METERRARKYEELKSLEDYTNLIKELDELAGEVCNTDKVESSVMKSIEVVSKAMYQKVKYVVDYSKRWRKKQSWFSVRRDLKLEREFEEQERQFEELSNAPIKQLSAPPEEPKLTFWGKVKKFFSNGKQNKTLPCPKESQMVENAPIEEKDEPLECAETDEKEIDEGKVDSNTQESADVEVLDSEVMDF